MQFGRFRASSVLLAAAFAGVALQGAAAQDAAPPPPAPPPPAQAAPPGQQAPAPARSTAVTHSRVNLRNGPGTSYTVVTLIPAGSSVEVSGCKSGWCQVVFDGNNGYIIESSIAPGSPGGAAPRRTAPPPGYAGPPGPPPPGYGVPPPGYYPPPPPAYYYGYGPYYSGPYWGWRRRYWWR